MAFCVPPDLTPPQVARARELSFHVIAQHGAKVSTFYFCDPEQKVRIERVCRQNGWNVWICRPPTEKGSNYEVVIACAEALAKAFREQN